METAKLKKFAQFARRSLIEQVSTKLKLVLAENSAARRENAEAIKKLDDAIHQHTKEQVIERVAYIWFNRFCALRFMDVNRYTRIGVVSAAEGKLQPEILAEAKMGHIDDGMVNDKTRQQIFALLDGKVPSRDPQGEAYRLLVVGACNHWHRAMPFLFQRIDDYTELLMPDDLLSGNSILAYTREAMTPDACEDVEVIGWLYQFYISEKKDEVFDGLKKNKKITPENIPAATQLFTPHWIVRYLVENSLGRLWMLNRPYSKLIEQMDYYIKPEQPETDFLRITKPEEIKICDPACGSAHMLTYAFDLLYAIYEEEGYEAAEIPEKILTHNLYGIEIDERAGELAAFALTMKARAKHKRFFGKAIRPNICVLENIQFDEDELNEYIDFIGRDLFTAPLQTTLRQFEEADNFGSLIRPELTDVQSVLIRLSPNDCSRGCFWPKSGVRSHFLEPNVGHTDIGLRKNGSLWDKLHSLGANRISTVQSILQLLEAKDVSGQLFLSETHKKVLQALRQADYLSPKYHVVIANPPYMGARNMSGRLGAWLKDNYEPVKSDLFSSFIIRCSEIGIKRAFIGVMCPNVWMYISTHEHLRSFLINSKRLLDLVELPLTGFKGATVQICAFNFTNSIATNALASFIKLTEFKGGDDEMASFTREAISTLNCKWFYQVNTSDFSKIPGNPIAYWVSSKVLSAFGVETVFESYATPRQGLGTTNNDLFVRFWSEVNFSRISFGCANRKEALLALAKWFPYTKGGGYRKWFGNDLDVINWQNDGQDIREALIGKNPNIPRSETHYFKEGITWGLITSASFSARYSKQGGIFDVGGSKAFPPQDSKEYFLGLLNSHLSSLFLKTLNPTLNFQVGDLKRIPIIRLDSLKSTIRPIIKNIVDSSKLDWDSYETSWDFTSLPLLNPDYRQPALKTAYQKLRVHWQEMTLEMQRLEEENNRIFIDVYGLQDELTPEVPLNEITLTCNPHYRYGDNKNEEELEELLLADTMRELVSYAVGCMFGRYALDKPGLILANQGENFDDYLKQVPEPSFPADADNVIPMLDGDWFIDDIAERFRKFLRVAFGEEHYEENLQFVEKALGKNGKPRDIRDYFLKDFYNDHVKRYKKRPIYWLFSSPNGSFNALIYMHRYRPDTVSVVLNDYLREFRTKLASHKNHLEAVSISASASQGEKTKALKEIEKLNKMIVEMEEYEREALYPLATEQMEIDLDDGVKVNYLKLGAALKKIPGLDEKEME